MIIRRLHLHPFAGTANREFDFSPGLNVILGPNEAGKTTLGHALRQALFVSTKLTKRDTDREVAPYLPLGGGDTICVSVDFELDDKNWSLEKRWAGGSSASELLLPSGGKTSDTEAVDAQLADLLGLSRGTWEHALFAYQGDIGAPLNDLSDSEAVHDLNEVLRRAVFQTDGVSIEALGKTIEDRWDLAFGRWDRSLKRPEGNRGLENPWRNKAGHIVNSWYDQERARDTLEEAEEYYRQLDDVTGRLNAAASASEALRSWVANHTAEATDAEKRAVLEGRLAGVAGKEGTLREVSQAWPVAEARASELESEATALTQKVKELSNELLQAQAWETAATKRSTLKQALSFQEQIDGARQALEAAPKVEAEQIETLERLEQARSRLSARLDAAKLAVTFRAHRAMDVEFQAGVEPLEAHSLAEGEVREFMAGARAVVRHAEWEVEVRSDNMDIAAEETSHREITEEASTLLKTIGAEDLSGARELLSDFKEKGNRLSNLTTQLSELLGEQSLAELRAEIDRGGVGEPKRDSAQVAGDRGKAEADSENVRRDANKEREKVAAWESTYKTTDALLDELVERRAERKKLESEMAALQPLPEGIEDAQHFLSEFREKKGSLDSEREAFNELLREKDRLEGKAPELEPAEAAEQLAQAEAAFQQARRNGEAIDLIRHHFDALRTEMDEGTLEPWLEHLAEYVSPLTQKGSRTIDVAAGTLGHDSAEAEVPFEVLSTGTRAWLGLAVRLSMARWFLQDRGGFIFLDDPLVDLDPERQQAVAAILKKFASEKQVILLTCHPRHAEILGGETIAY